MGLSCKPCLGPVLRSRRNHATGAYAPAAVFVFGRFLLPGIRGCEVARKFDAVVVAVRLAPDVRRQWYQLAAVRGERLSDVLRAGLTIGAAVLAVQSGGTAGQAVNDGNG